MDQSVYIYICVCVLLIKKIKKIILNMASFMVWVWLFVNWNICAGLSFPADSCVMSRRRRWMNERLQRERLGRKEGKNESVIKLLRDDYDVQIFLIELYSLVRLVDFLCDWRDWLTRLYYTLMKIVCPLCRYWTQQAETTKDIKTLTSILIQKEERENTKYWKVEMEKEQNESNKLNTFTHSACESPMLLKRI